MKLVLTDDTVEITVFNRGITLFTSDDEQVRRMHRVRRNRTNQERTYDTSESRHGQSRLIGPSCRRSAKNPPHVVFQSRVPMDVPERLFLVRVFVDIDRRPPEIVTAYRTSKIEKYWRKEQ